MTGDEIRLRIIEALISKAPQSPDLNVLIERAKVITAYVMPDNPQGPGTARPILSIAADKQKPRNPT